MKYKFFYLYLFTLSLKCVISPEDSKDKGMGGHLPLYYESRSKRSFFLLTNVHFDISSFKNFFSFIKNCNQIYIHTQKKDFCIAFWFDPQQDKILGVLKATKRHFILSCFTKKWAKKGKKWLEDELKDTIKFRAYSYERLKNPWKEERVTLKQYLTCYYEREWVRTPLATLNNKTPLQLLKEPLRRRSLMEFIRKMKENLLSPYDFARLQKRLNLNVVCHLDKQLEKQKISLQQQLLTCLNASLRLLLAIEETDTASAEIVEPLILLTQLVDKLNELAFLVDQENSYRNFKELSKKLYEILDKIEKQLVILLNSLPEKEKVVELYTDTSWDHLNITANTDPVFPLPRCLAKDVMLAWRNKAEEISISHDMDLSTILEKQPFDWLEAIATFLKLPNGKKTKEAYVETITTFLKQPSNLAKVLTSLPIEGHGLLRVVLEAGGSFPYRCLVKYFGSEVHDGFYWQIKPPKSIIGNIRARGLLFVGNMKRMGMLTKVAFIPADLRPILHRFTTNLDNILRLPE